MQKVFQWKHAWLVKNVFDQKPSLYRCVPRGLKCETSILSPPSYLDHIASLDTDHHHQTLSGTLDGPFYPQRDQINFCLGRILSKEEKFYPFSISPLQDCGHSWTHTDRQIILNWFLNDSAQFHILYWIKSRYWHYSFETKPKPWKKLIKTSQPPAVTSSSTSSWSWSPTSWSWSSPNLWIKELKARMSKVEILSAFCSVHTAPSNVDVM